MGCKGDVGARLEIPTYIEDAVRNHRPGWNLAGIFYRDPVIFELDMERVFRRHWLFAGHVSQVANTGDYFTFGIGGESLIIVNDARGQIRALLNVCRHRGSELCSESAGHVERITCPYHQWVYGLDGKLQAYRFTTEEFDPQSSGLLSAHVRIIEGLIFVCLSETAPSLDDVERDITSHLALHQLANAKIASTRTYQVHANWKLIDENARECYHCPGSHPEYCSAVYSAAHATSSAGSERVRQRQTAEEIRWRELGLCVERMPFRPGTLHSVNRYALRKGVVTESLDGHPVAPLMGALRHRDVGVVGIGVYPSLLAEACSDHAVLLGFKPLGPQLTEVQISWLVRNDAREQIDYRVDEIEAVWGATAEQDWRLCEANQRGVNSISYKPGAYTTIECGCDHFDQWYVHQLRTYWPSTVDS